MNPYLIQMILSKMLKESKRNKNKYYLDTPKLKIE